MIVLLFDHLWQSTLFMAAVGLLTQALKRNGAAVRYTLWFMASVKFLVPFAVLVSAGAYLAGLMAPVSYASPVLYVMASAAHPFSAATPMRQAPAAASFDLTLVLLALWLPGFVAIVAVWVSRRFKLNAALRGAWAVPLAVPVPVRSSAASMEPGLIGVWRPVLFLPEGIAVRLSPNELQTVLAHELCHLRRRDNLTAAIHMLVEALFWFYPPVWWLGQRLIAERERACDEHVLQSGNDPQTYAESILKVCKFYAQSQLACAAGVSGADLKQRMEDIMKNDFARRLNGVKMTLLAAAATVAIAAPVLAGFATAGGAPQASADEVRRNLAEQALPRTEIAIDPATFDRYAGYYQMAPNLIFHISRNGNRYFEGVIGDTPVEMYPESESKFFLKGLSLPAQFSFTMDAGGRAVGMVLHQSGAEQAAVRIGDADGKRAEAALARRVADNKPSPGTEAALRRDIAGLTLGQPDYDLMVGPLAAGTRQMLPDIQARLKAWGPLTSVAFDGVDKSGMDVYLVTFQNARTKWSIAPLTTDGKIAGIFFGPA
jgi:beta-lactamase regulating signal transducer with metallopeptidase domain